MRQKKKRGNVTERRVSLTLTLFSTFEQVILKTTKIIFT